MPMQMVCEKCGKEYTLGINGVMSGCDACMKITRNKDNMIIYPTPTNEQLKDRYLNGPV